jgi:hypothetical protein
MELLAGKLTSVRPCSRPAALTVATEKKEERDERREARDERKGLRTED